MALKVEAVGVKSRAVAHEYSWQDVVLYALSVGTPAEDLDFLYEGRGPLVLPTYAVVVAYEANALLYPVVGGDPAAVVHGEQAVTLHKPFPAAGKLTTVAEVAGIYDLRKTAIGVIVTRTTDAADELVCETKWTYYYLRDGGFGGQPPPRAPRVLPPKRPPDWTFEQQTSPEQALLYRLNGDHNPLHADPAEAAKASEVTRGRPILHGLCTYGYLGRAALARECDNAPRRLTSLSARFAKPVWPGETLVVDGWHESGEDQVVMRARTKERMDEEVVTNAVALISS